MVNFQTSCRTEESQKAVGEMSTNLDSSNELNPISPQHWINISAPMNLPSADLLDTITTRYVFLYIKHQIRVTGKLLKLSFTTVQRPELIRYSITENYETTLHIAVSAKYTKRGEEFVKKLVALMKTDDLQLENGNGETALCVAAVAGYVQMAKIMVDKNKALLTIPDSKGKLPLCMAALFGRRDMVKYLYDSSQKMSGEFWTHENRDYVFMKCIEADLFDIALQIVNDRLELATSGDALRILARKPDAFKKERNTALMESITLATKASSALQLLRIICDSILELDKNVIDDIIRGPSDPTKKGKKTADCKNQAQDETPTTSEVQNPKYSSQMLFIAAEKGNKTFVVELIRRYPDLIRKVNDNKQSLFHVAVSHRRKDICSLLYQIGSIKDSVITLEDENGNNMLHLVGERAKSDQLQDEKGIVLQVQQELLWFKEVEAILPPSFQEMKNKDGLTPRELFTKGHKDQVSKAEKWLKDVAAQLMGVAALIATIAFAATITIPGGLSQETGDPIFLHKSLFMVFMILDSFSLLFSSASIFILISILTSRYAELDFLKTLPTKLLLCLLTLFYALATMMLTFFINLFILNQNKSIGRVVGVFAYLLGAIFTSLQYPIFVGMIQLIYYPKPIFYH